MNRWLSVAMAAMAVALLVGGAFRPGGAQGPARPDVGYTAPDFTLPDLTGTAVQLSDYRGQGVLINFWATWCPPCQAEMPELKKLHDGAADLVVLGVDMGHLESSPETVAAFMRRHGYTWRIAFDGAGEVSSAYGVISIPTSFFIDPAGVIRARFVGPMSLPVMSDLARLVSR